MLTIRKEHRDDQPAVFHVNKTAFGRADEAWLVDKLRERPGIEFISLVAELNREIIGHILFTPVTVQDGPITWEAIALGPMAILPPYQNQGFGSELIRAGLEACLTAGHTVVFVLGHSNYYPRFGFVKAQSKGLRWEQNAPPEAFMVAELQPGALDGRQGIVSYLPEFTDI
ncbi:MAG: N-acetyltransferase [Ardenticatenaceae bacterium]|nr:N-acetyltransferase [Ardenticatenaceae bacterium]